MAKKKKKSKKKKVKEYDPPVYQIPIYEDPDVVTPKVQLFIKHQQMDIPDQLALKLTIHISAPISRVAKAISRHHQQTVSDVIICKDKYDPEQALQHEFSLQKCGITGPNAHILYDYIPFTYPLIG